VLRTVEAFVLDTLVPDSRIDAAETCGGNLEVVGSWPLRIGSAKALQILSSAVLDFGRRKVRDERAVVVHRTRYNRAREPGPGFDEGRRSGRDRHARFAHRPTEGQWELPSGAAVLAFVRRAVTFKTLYGVAPLIVHCLKRD